MIVWILAAVEYEDFNIIGVFSSEERAKEHAAKNPPNPQREDFWLEAYEVDGGYEKLLVSRDGKTWELRKT